MTYHHFFHVLLLGTCLTYASCSNGATTPVFLDASGTTPASTQPAPSVNGDLTSQLGLEKIVFHVGPVDLPAGQETSEMIDRPLVMRFELSHPMWIIGFEPKIVDAHGTSLPATLLQRALVLNMNEENVLCNNSSVGNPFVASTSSLTPLQFPEGYGYALLPKDTLEARVIFKNTTSKNYTGVFYEISLLAKPMDELSKFTDVKPMLIDLDPCDHKPLQIAPGEFAERSGKVPIPTAGSLILAQGFLQDFGASISLQKKGTQKPFWQTQGKLDVEHHLLELVNNPYQDPAGTPLRVGDELDVSIVYDNASKKWLNDAFSGVMIYIIPVQ